MAELLKGEPITLTLKDARGRSWVQFEWVIGGDLSVEAEDSFERVRVVLGLEQSRALLDYLKVQLDPRVNETATIH